LKDKVLKISNSTGGYALWAFVALALAAPALAQQTRILRDGSGWVEEMTGTMPVATTMVVKMDVGSVSVHGSGAGKPIAYRLRIRAMSPDQNEARREFERCKLSATKTGNTDTIMSAWASGGVTPMAMETLEIEAPQNLSMVRIMTRGAATVNGIDGRVEVTSGAGNLNVDNVGGSVKASTAGGSVAVGTVGGDVELSTGGGNVTINSVKGRIVTSSGGGNIVVTSADQGVSLQTAGGTIDVRKCKGALSAQTGGGSLDLGQVDGKAFLQTAGGSIRMSSGPGPVVATTGAGQIELYGLTHGVQVQSGAGRIIAEFVGSSFSISVLETSMGDVIVYLSPDLKATVHAEVLEAHGHHIQSELPGVATVDSGRGLFGTKRLTADGKLNGGGPELRIRTTGGDIELRRANK
jgi:DUF4097 and DUF4098 domain-containing protein YvlB